MSHRGAGAAPIGCAAPGRGDPKGDVCPAAVLVQPRRSTQANLVTIARSAARGLRPIFAFHPAYVVPMAAFCATHAVITRAPGGSQRHPATGKLGPSARTLPVACVSFYLEFPFMLKRQFLTTSLAALAMASASFSVQAQTPIKFQLDWRFEGPSAFFLVPAAKGYFKA
ncbi:MAG: hypothetical protein VW518_11150, partial [Burkholderiaceae bacterium]